ncbi:MAG TPA: polysaccharide deacetylase family protein [Steroidobacteraceae bacterium]|nr:polysaccharide deacetylase family protein [Steroidobacteraceae bacterium]
MQLALKIDVDTLRGTREGLPALLRVLAQQRADATFLFSLGPDHTGRALRRVFRPGFFGKVTRTSVLEHYGLRTLLYGTLLPGPDIARRAGGCMRSARAAGHEVGVHCYDHTAWQDLLSRRDADWARGQMQRAVQRFGEVFGEAPRVHGAAGWQVTEAALAAEEEMGFVYASDTRGTGPFVPWLGDRVSRCPQLPTTLPTLDELIGTGGLHPANVHERLLALTDPRAQPAATRGSASHVFTLHAELEGMKLRAVLERLLAGWRAQGYELVALRTLLAELSIEALPAARVQAGTVPGRSGTLAVQGAGAA